MSDVPFQAAAFEGRLRGLSVPAIAKALHVTPAEVEAAVLAELTEAPPSLDPEQNRILDLARCDRMIAAAWPNAIKTNPDPAAIDRVDRLMERRQRLLGEPARVKDAITDAFELTLAALDVEPADAAIVSACRQVARQIDYAVAYGTSLEATKAMYLLPHLWNGLRELGATPAARAALKAAMPTPPPPAPTPDPDQEVPVDLDSFKKARRGGA